MCIKLVNYWDKYTEMHGQQNDKYTEMHGHQNDKYTEMHSQQNVKILVLFKGINFLAFWFWFANDTPKTMGSQSITNNYKSGLHCERQPMQQCSTKIINPNLM